MDIDLKDIDKEILNLFYRTELRDNEQIIDNRDSVIAEELNLPTSYVSGVINTSLENKKVSLDFEIENYEESESYKDQIIRDLKLENKSLRFNNIELTNRLSDIEKELKLSENKRKTFNKNDFKDSFRVNQVKILINKGFKSKEIPFLIGYKTYKGINELFKRRENITFKNYIKQLNK